MSSAPEIYTYPKIRLTCSPAYKIFVLLSDKIVLTIALIIKEIHTVCLFYSLSRKFYMGLKATYFHVNGYMCHHSYSDKPIPTIRLSAASDPVIL